jgi:hypothetical protein
MAGPVTLVFAAMVAAVLLAVVLLFVITHSEPRSNKRK